MLLVGEHQVGLLLSLLAFLLLHQHLFLWVQQLLLELSFLPLVGKLV
jgi:hypothetical protein